METLLWGSPGAQPGPGCTMTPAGADSGVTVTAAEGETGASPSQGRQANGSDAVLQSTEQTSSILCSVLSWKSQIIRGGSWCGQTEWMLQAGKNMPKFLIAWAYRVQWLPLAHEIEPFALPSAFPPQLGPQVAFSSVWKEESCCHLSKELIKTQNTFEWSFKQGEASGWSFGLWLCYRVPRRTWYETPLLGYSQTTVIFTAKQKGYSYIAIDLHYSKAVFSGKIQLKRVGKAMDSKMLRKDFSKL